MAAGVLRIRMTLDNPRALRRYLRAGRLVAEAAKDFPWRTDLKQAARLLRQCHQYFRFQGMPMTQQDTRLASVDELFGQPLRRRYDTCTLPVSGLRVRYQSLSEREVSAYQMAAMTSDGSGMKRNRMEDAARRLIVLCLVDADGNRLLGDSHIAKLAEWDGADAQYLYERIAKHCGINRREIEDLAKNSGAIDVAD